MKYFLKKKLLLSILLLLILFEYFNLFKNKKKLYIAICTIAKDENKYILEFIQHYENLGVKKIFLYDNNNINGETFDSILKKYILNKFVQIINYRGKYKPQRKAYGDCYKNNKYLYDWIAFYDIDEYLHIINYENINDFLSLPRFKKCSSLIINWKYYGDNNNLYYKPKPLKERFTKPFYFSKKQKNKNKLLYGASKSIVRGGLNITWAHFPHFLKNKNICRPNGNIIKTPLSRPQYSIAYIKHFVTKSTEEYADKLIKGTVNSKQANTNKLKIRRIKKYYFLFNKITRKKIDLFEKKFNIKLNKNY